MTFKILIGVGLILAAFFIYIAIQPNDFRIGREMDINATSEVLFPHINNLHAFNAWSPWAKWILKGSKHLVGLTPAWVRV